MSRELRLAMETVRTLAFGSIGAGYTGIGTRVEHPVRILYVSNLTDAALMFSLDGVNGHFALPANGFLLLDVTSNKTYEQGFYLAEGERLYVTRIGVPTVGNVYLSIVYGE